MARARLVGQSEVMHDAAPYVLAGLAIVCVTTLCLYAYKCGHNGYSALAASGTIGGILGYTIRYATGRTSARPKPRSRRKGK